MRSKDLEGMLGTTERGAWLALGIMLAFGLSIYFFNISQALQARIPLDYGEGPLLNQARLLAEGRSIYRPDLSDYPYTVANYPPLYPLAVSVAGRLLGFSYATGRVVSILATLASGLAVGFIVRQITKDWIAAGIASGLFLSFPYVVYWGSLGRVDMLALAFSLWGIWAALRWPDSPAGLGLSLLLLAAAIFTRQSYLLAAPLAVTTYLALQNRSRAILFAVALGASVFAIGGALHYGTKGGIFLHTVVANTNTFFPIPYARSLGKWPAAFCFTDCPDHRRGSPLCPPARPEALGSRCLSDRKHTFWSHCGQNRIKRELPLGMDSGYDPVGWDRLEPMAPGSSPANAARVTFDPGLPYTLFALDGPMGSASL